MDNTKIPRTLRRPDIDKYFSVDGHLLKAIWCMNKEIDIKADNGKWYHAKYVSSTRSREDYIALKRINKPI